MAVRTKLFVLEGKSEIRRPATLLKCYICNKERLVATRKVKDRKTNLCLECYRTRVNPFKIRKYMPKMARDSSGKYIGKEKT